MDLPFYKRVSKVTLTPSTPAEDNPWSDQNHFAREMNKPTKRRKKYKQTLSTKASAVNKRYEAVVEFVSRKPVGLSEVCKGMGLSSSTGHSILMKLVKAGKLEKRGTIYLTPSWSGVQNQAEAAQAVQGVSSSVSTDNVRFVRADNGMPFSPNREALISYIYSRGNRPWPGAAAFKAATKLHSMKNSSIHSSMHQLKQYSYLIQDSAGRWSVNPAKVVTVRGGAVNTRTPQPVEKTIEPEPVVQPEVVQPEPSMAVPEAPESTTEARPVSTTSSGNAQLLQGLESLILEYQNDLSGFLDYVRRRKDS